jgi:MoxR-like ATPase
MLTSPLRDRMRPETLADIVGNTRTKESLRRMIEARRREHLIFIGAIGTGKSTLAEVVRREIADPMWSVMLKPRFNSSHYSGVEFVRHLLAKSCPRTTRLRPRRGARSQHASADSLLLSAMEDSTSSDLFFFCTTELHKLLPALRRRCR